MGNSMQRALNQRPGHVGVSKATSGIFGSQASSTTHGSGEFDVARTKSTKLNLDGVAVGNPKQQQMFSRAAWVTQCSAH